MDDRWSAGWLPYPRNLFRSADRGGSPFWNKKRVYSEHEAWEYLWVRSAHGPHDYALDGGHVIHLEAGETPPLSIRWLMKAWGWRSRKKVESFLKTLLSMGELRKAKSTQKGDTYLFANPLPTSNRGDSGGTAGGQRGDEVVKGKKKGSRESTGRASRGPLVYTPIFEEAFAQMPNRGGFNNPKAAAFRAWMAREKEGVEAAAMLAAAGRYGDFCDATGLSGTQRAMQAATFFGPDRPFEQEFLIPQSNGNGNGRRPW